jgi:hypothetical protein
MSSKVRASTGAGDVSSKGHSATGPCRGGGLGLPRQVRRLQYLPNHIRRIRLDYHGADPACSYQTRSARVHRAHRALLEYTVHYCSMLHCAL